MEIKELNFVEKLTKDSVIGGDSYDYSYSYSYDFESYFPYPIFYRLRDDFGTITIEVIQTEPEVVTASLFATTEIGIPPELPFG